VTHCLVACTQNSENASLRDLRVGRLGRVTSAGLALEALDILAHTTACGAALCITRTTVVNGWQQSSSLTTRQTVRRYVLKISEHVRLKNNLDNLPSFTKRSPSVYRSLITHVRVRIVLQRLSLQEWTPRMPRIQG